MLWWVAAAWAADGCPAPTQPVELAVRLSSAEQAYGQLDVAAFNRAVDESQLMVPCLGGLVSPTLAAQYHRVQGIRLYIASQRDRAFGEFRSAGAIDPSYQFPDALLPTGHAIRKAYADALAAGPGDTAPIPEPASGTVFVDGQSSRERPVERPVFVQLTDVAGTVSATAYALPGDRLPSYAVKLSGTKPPTEPVTPKKRYKPNFVLLGAGGAALLASGITYGLASGAKKDFYEDDDTRTLDELTKLQAKANGLGVTSAGLLGVGVIGVGASFALGSSK